MSDILQELNEITLLEAPNTLREKIRFKVSQQRLNQVNMFRVGVAAAIVLFFLTAETIYLVRDISGRSTKALQQLTFNPSSGFYEQN